MVIQEAMRLCNSFKRKKWEDQYLYVSSMGYLLWNGGDSYNAFAEDVLADDWEIVEDDSPLKDLW